MSTKMTIDGEGTRNYYLTKKTLSHRARSDNGKPATIEVIRKKCPHCFHHKAIKNNNSGDIKCSRCKRSH